MLDLIWDVFAVVGIWFTASLITVGGWALANKKTD